MVGRNHEGRAIRPVLAFGAAGCSLPGDVHLTSRAEREVRPLVTTDPTRDLARCAEMRAVIGRAAEEDRVAAGAVEVGPGGVDVAGHRIDTETGLVIEMTQPKRVRGENDGAYVARAVRARVSRVRRLVGRHPNI